jgi:hypothetical protein
MRSHMHDLSTCKLVRCDLFNKKLDKSVRFIELDKFQLWMYMMHRKHGFSFGNKSLYLWVNGIDYQSNSVEYQRQENLFGLSRKRENVDMIEMELFDDRNNFSFTIRRFVPSSETERMKKILISHANERLLNNSCIDTKIYPGYALGRYDDIGEFISGLSSSEYSLISELEVEKQK